MVDMVFHCFPMVFIWFSHGFPMVFLWLSYGCHSLPMVFQRFSYGCPLVFIWFHMVSYGFHMLRVALLIATMIVKRIAILLLRSISGLLA